MKIKAIVEGKEVEFTISDEDAEKIGIKKEKARTGYEQVKRGQPFYYVNVDSHVTEGEERKIGGFEGMCEYIGNYYSDKSIAEANARADTLMRKLRRYAVEHGGIPSRECLIRRGTKCYGIGYNPDSKCIGVNTHLGNWIIPFGTVYFNDSIACADAIKEFETELIWYFTEYEAMLYDNKGGDN